ncbi:MAG: DEAD/DEAH box helicase [Planctomycetes bacterium]|nr:DEAD/DEAH box helicase [Planctomycetota bacterium]
MAKIQLALAKTFLESYSKLPKKQMKKVRELTERFQENPEANGFNFEALGPGFRDPKVRSIRVDQSYRIIAVASKKGDVILCVWVDHHDEAYSWAERKMFEVNPLSGIVQVYSMESGMAPVLEEAPVEKGFQVPNLFSTIDDEQLLLAGVPQPLLETVRSLGTDVELDDLAPHLPEDACDMLYLLASGYEFFDALEESSRPKEPVAAVDTDDFAAALVLPETQRAFHIVDGEQELEDILEAPLEQWRVFLHPSQRRLVQRPANGPVRVLGGAGTGKTVVMMHRAKHLAESVFSAADDRILVTTYTRNLANDLKKAIKGLAPGVGDRIEVNNLHAWARSFYESQVGSRLKVLMDNQQRMEFMESATSAVAGDEYSAAFYMEEWDQVVQAQATDGRSAYLRARRVGRGTRLGRAQRIEVWKVLSCYRSLLDQEGLMELQDVVREATLYLEANPNKVRYRAVLADEVQDFSPQDLRLIRALVPPGPNDLFLVGDAHQRIYGQMTSLGSCGIEIRGRAKRLKLNYRTTEQIRISAVTVLENLNVDDLDGGVDTLKGYHSVRTGPEPRIVHSERAEQEQEVILKTLEQWLEKTAPHEICIAARTNTQVDRYSKVLAQQGIEFQILKGEAPAAGPKVHLATMHRLKGLEYKKVLLCGIQSGQVPLPAYSAADKVSKADHAQRERCLFYVASTRARDELVITGFGKPSEFLKG